MSSTANAQEPNGQLAPADYEQIQNLYGQYSHAFDSGDGPALANTYTQDGTFVTGGKTVASGRDQLLAQPRPPAAGKPSMRHLPANLVIERSPEGAKGKSYVFLVTFEAGKPPAVAAGGVYEDVIVKTPAGWRFKKRTFTPFGAPAQASEGAARQP